MKQAQVMYGGGWGQFGFGGGQSGGGRHGSTAPTEVFPAEEPPVTEVTYSDAAIAELLYMIEEEKLAGDVYEAFYEMYGLKIFDNIAASEDKHFDALIAQAESLGIDTDAFVFAEAGSFEDPELQALYDDLIATGAASVTAALEVGVAIEEKDMVDIAAAAEDVAGTALADIYENLLAGSANHLQAFEGLLA